MYRRRIAVSSSHGIFVAARTRTPKLSVSTPERKSSINIHTQSNTCLSFEQENQFSHNSTIRHQFHQ